MARGGPSAASSGFQLGLSVIPCSLLDESTEHEGGEGPCKATSLACSSVSIKWGSKTRGSRGSSVTN